MINAYIRINNKFFYLNMTRRTKPANAPASATTKTAGAARGRKPKEETKPKNIKVSINEVIPTKIKLKCKNLKQKEFVNLIATKEIVIASGPAGVGKSYIAIAKALELMQETDSPYTTLVIVKPAVEADENYGFLPGNLKEKMEPHVASSIDIIDKIVGETTRINLEEGRVIKIEPLGFLRGKTIDNSIVIVEEAQNMTPSQMKTALTRIGSGTKYIISGDLDQSDKYDDVTKSGLYDALQKHRNIEEIGFFEFNEDDIVRNPLITKILKNYKKKGKTLSINVGKSFNEIDSTGTIYTKEGITKAVDQYNKKNNKPYIDPNTGCVDLKYNPHTINEDIWLGTPKSNDNVSIDTLENTNQVKKSWFQRNFKW